MRKITTALVTAVSLFLSSCGSNMNTTIPMATSTLQETATTVQLLDLPTPEFTPMPNKASNENDWFLVTLGEKVNRQGWWPAIPAFSHDGKMIALVSERVRLWNVETHELIYELNNPYSNCYTENIAFSTDDSLLAASIYDTDSNATGHVLIWDTQEGILLKDWEQAFSKNTSKVEGVLNSHPATGIAFLPNSTLLAIANGNTIEIRDARKESNSLVLELGDDMVATSIAISRDRKSLFAFMDFSYWKPPNEIGQEYALQIWDLNSEELVEKLDFPEPDNTGAFYEHFDTEIRLEGTNLVTIDYINETFTVTNLETGDIKNLYYLGDVKTFISQDTKYVSYIPNLFDCEDKGFELWDTHLNQSFHTFPASHDDFDTEWCRGLSTITFSLDNTILAIAHEERVSLWDISSFTKAK